MRLLIVGLPHSVHIAKWIGMLSGHGWDIRIFPSVEAPPHAELRDVTLYETSAKPLPFGNPSLRVHKVASPRPRFIRRLSRIKTNRAMTLAAVIQQFKPDIVHSQEFQHGAYLTLEARQILGEQFPPWIVSNWGSDIYLFGRLPGHPEKIRAVLELCDYYTCECQRDVGLAIQFGLRGETLPVLPVGGGYDLAWARSYRTPGPTSARRAITLKGYQGWAGRAMVGLRALEICGQHLAGYRLALYLATPEVAALAEMLCAEIGMELEVVSQLPGMAPYDEILRMQGRSRVSIGLSISDAISTSFLETIMLGAFPIQSNTGCANEWIQDGVSGILVPPEDPQPIAAAILRAITDDALVDQAAAINDETVSRRLDLSVVRPQAITLYEHVAAQGPVLRRVGSR